MKTTVLSCIFVCLTLTICFSGDYKVVIKSTGKIIEGDYNHETDNTIYLDVNGIQVQFKKSLLDFDKMKELNKTLPKEKEKPISKEFDRKEREINLYGTKPPEKKEPPPDLGAIAAEYAKKRQPPLKASVVEHPTEQKPLNLRSTTGAYGTFLWKLENEQGPLYLLGSIHAANKSFYPLPDVMEKAYKESRTVAVEVDILKNDVNDPEEIFASYLDTVYYPAGETLQKHISKETYRLLTKEFERFSYDNFQLERVRPWAIAQFIEGSQTVSVDMDSNLGIDVYYLNRARSQQKKIVELESMELQMKLFDGFTDKEQEMYLLAALKDLSQEREKMNLMMSAWQEGDVQTMENIINEAYPANSELASYRKKILTERNKGMLAKIQNLIDEQGTDLVIVGAAHMLGPDGIVALLRNKGYKIVRQ